MSHIALNQIFSLKGESRKIVPANDLILRPHGEYSKALPIIVTAAEIGMLTLTLWTAQPIVGQLTGD
jgi:hypothetical protein